MLQARSLNDNVGPMPVASLSIVRMLRQIRRVALTFGMTFAPNRVINLLSMDADALGEYQPQPDLISADVYYGDLNLVSDTDGFILLS